MSSFFHNVDWHHESYPAYRDFYFLPLFALFFPSIRFFLDRFFFQKLARRLIFGKGNENLDLHTDERRKKIRKFKESAWKCLYYLSAEILALYVTYDEPWFTNTRNFWVGPGSQVWPDQKTKLKLKAVYMYAAGFYSYSIFALIFWETRRSDFGVSMSHHVATVILIVLSYIFRFARVGSVVLAIHDASDVFLEIGKMSKYSGAETVASFAFILFVLSWIILRLIYYPFWILWSTRICKGQRCKRWPRKVLDVEWRHRLASVMSEKGLSTCDPRAEMGIGDSVESKWNEQIEFGKGEKSRKSLKGCFGMDCETMQAVAVVDSSPTAILLLQQVLCYEVLLTLDKEKHRVDGPIYYYLFNSLLYCLLVMHIYWWVLIFRMLVKQIEARGKVSEDVRSGKLKMCCVQNVN
ncbi:hypothetical protein V8G54_005024 [Vigna mungo]|uniref:TLC domain-containing protein n=1 Tax=Vigna mungo TaxID=3915 RepID=A0AAQ3PJF7_VIGMU